MQRAQEDPHIGSQALHIEDVCIRCMTVLVWIRAKNVSMNIYIYTCGYIILYTPVYICNANRISWEALNFHHTKTPHKQNIQNIYKISPCPDFKCAESFGQGLGKIANGAAFWSLVIRSRSSSSRTNCGGDQRLVTFARVRCRCIKWTEMSSIQRLWHSVAIFQHVFFVFSLHASLEGRLSWHFFKPWTLSVFWSLLLPGKSWSKQDRWPHWFSILSFLRLRAELLLQLEITMPKSTVPYLP